MSASTNGWADPSHAGSSGPEISTTTLSMPRPASALMQCSQVSMATSPLRRAVRRARLPTFWISAGIRTGWPPSATSVR